MKKLFILCLVVAAAFAFWKFGGQPTGNDPLADLEHRLEAAEKAYQSAGRAAGMSGLDSTADAEAAIAEVHRVEQALREMSRTATSPEVKTRIHRLLDQTAAVERKMK